MNGFGAGESSMESNLGVPASVSSLLMPHQHGLSVQAHAPSLLALQQQHHHHQQQQQQQQQHQNLFKRAFGVRENVRVRFLNGRNHSFGEARIENHAFEDIRDEDL